MYWQSAASVLDHRLSHMYIYSSGIVATNRNFERSRNIGCIVLMMTFIGGIFASIVHVRKMASAVRLMSQMSKGLGTTGLV